MDSLDKNLPYLLALLRIPDMGPSKLKKMMNLYPKLSQVFSENNECLMFPGISVDWKGVEKDLKWLEQDQTHILSLKDPLYPSLLKEISGAPPVIFVRGQVELLSQPQIAMVGSRNPTNSGSEIAKKFARELSKKGLIITSGLALGIDGLSHEGALDFGETIAVLANGLDQVYPHAHRKLADRVIERGALVSEFPTGVPPVPIHFPRRNRIISGLSMGTFVVEAALRSGSLITAHYALDQGRDVFAMPGSIHSSQSKGCHALIRQGAKLIEKPEDILEELSPMLEYMSFNNNSFVQKRNKAKQLELDFNLKAPSKTRGAPEDEAVNFNLYKNQNRDSVFETQCELLLYQVGYEATPLDNLLSTSGLTVAEVSSILLELELKGLIRTVHGGYERIHI